MVGLGGLEPPTSPLSGVCSSQLSYRPELGTPKQSVRLRNIYSDPHSQTGYRSSNMCERLRRGMFHFLFKGGDPAAGSPTATLLRLHPSH